MKTFFSKISPDLLLHTIHRKEDFPSKDGRVDLSPKHEYLQLSAVNISQGKKFRPHKHKECNKSTLITQESWVVIQGIIKVVLYDVDDEIIFEGSLSSGDCLITFRGGHTFESLEDETLLYEFKNGPYFGQEKDKEFIE